MITVGGSYVYLFVRFVYVFITCLSSDVRCTCTPGQLMLDRVTCAVLPVKSPFIGLACIRNGHHANLISMLAFPTNPSFFLVIISFW